MAIAGMPEQMSELGCDNVLWDSIPMGAQRDIKRFLGTGKEDLARRRIATMKEILQFADEPPNGTFDRAKWDQTMSSWEANETKKLEMAKAKAKAERMGKAKAKAAREAAEAEKGAQ
eukprot:CAMPEP_0113323072 /NCGR_PEP_ID=MMETSP0010_2-20120614/16040_1 /TAXON_ID=216773 ORGANISM="Corethron hystrix, Strain 308" /NCGR_SAMPLE_ID=MMETSP0010_2 /ASSEMBLY_ACC=CAM_ASM_000155 /LENGTH=116 /DNA_ID=CAMNT_0000181807 /DNA_START=104 /DNA_END=454 /DNA_ORIENTATION=+ /assembly_acc=CAM_ASM_000155